MFYKIMNLQILKKKKKIEIFKNSESINSKDFF